MVSELIKGAQMMDKVIFILLSISSFVTVFLFTRNYYCKSCF
jgi:hypothetical protein